MSWCSVGMLFYLRPWGRHNLLVGECYVHGLMGGEAMKMLKRGEVAEEVYQCISWAGFVILVL